MGEARHVLSDGDVLAVGEESLSGSFPPGKSRDQAPSTGFRRPGGSLKDLWYARVT